MNITLEHVWIWLNAGCNAAEIAAYAQIDAPTAVAWVTAAQNKFAGLKSQQGSAWKV